MSSFNYAEFFRVWHRTDEQYAAQDLIAIECRVQRELAPLDAWRDDATYTPVIPMEDSLVHTDERPYCRDIMCPCHSDDSEEALAQRTRLLWQPHDDGLLTDDEKVRLFFGKQV